jgi:hypothetical protein
MGSFRRKPILGSALVKAKAGSPTMQYDPDKLAELWVLLAILDRRMNHRLRERHYFVCPRIPVLESLDSNTGIHVRLASLFGGFTPKTDYSQLIRLLSR